MKIFTSIIVIIIVIGVGIFAFRHAPEKQAETAYDDTASLPSNTEDTTDTSDTPSMNTNERTLANFTPVAKTETLQKTDIVVGTGKEVAPGATVSVHYTGAVAATGVIFQSSKDFGTAPITFPLNQVIKGWTDGIPGMKVGGTRRLVIPAAQAYGATPPPGSGIPANADLVFDVELVAVQ